MQAAALLLATSTVVGGVPDTQHAGVVAVVSVPGAVTPVFCSGVVIAPRVVVTAGHCTRTQDPTDLVVKLGADARAPDRTIAVLTVHTFPQFTGSSEDVRGGLDLGAVVLAEDAAVAVIGLLRAGGAGLVGGTGVIVGYGVTNPLDLATTGLRRQVTVPITAACDRLLAFGADTQAACLGDSGGPLLVAGPGGPAQVAAIVSFSDSDVCAPPAYGVLAERYAAWLDTIVAGMPDEACATTCPPAGTDCFAPDAGVDAPVAPIADAASDGQEAGGAGGGCALARHQRTQARTPLLLLLLGLAWLVRSQYRRLT